MQPVLLVIQFLLAVALVAVILLQRTAQDGGGLMGGGSTMGGLFTARGSANLLTRATAVLATLFILNSLALGFLASHAHQGEKLMDRASAPPLTAPPSTNGTSTPTASPPNPGEPAATVPATPSPTPTPKAPSSAPEVPMAH
jgi:preprotein translocase subunit SecG